MDIMTGIAAINGGLKIVKSLQGIDKGLDEATYKLKFAELYSALAEVKMALSDAQVAANERDGEIKSLESELQRILNFDGNLKDLLYQNGFHYRIEEFEHYGPRPYCPYCIEKKKGLYELRQIIDATRDDCRCPECGTQYTRAYSLEKRE